MDPPPQATALVERLHAEGLVGPGRTVHIDSFGDSPQMSADLLGLIRGGGKRAGSALLWSYQRDGQPLPQFGDLTIVVDHSGQPVMVTRVTQVDVVPFDEVDAEFAAAEGEGDRSLASWRAVRWEFFSRECRQLGRVASGEMLVVCERFELLGADLLATGD